jgi:hypothetical protein
MEAWLKIMGGGMACVPSNQQTFLVTSGLPSFEGKKLTICFLADFLKLQVPVAELEPSWPASGSQTAAAQESSAAQSLQQSFEITFL